MGRFDFAMKEIPAPVPAIGAGSVYLRMIDPTHHQTLDLLSPSHWVVMVSSPDFLAWRVDLVTGLKYQALQHFRSLLDEEGRIVVIHDRAIVFDSSCLPVGAR